MQLTSDAPDMCNTFAAWIIDDYYDYATGTDMHMVAGNMLFGNIVARDIKPLELLCILSLPEH